MTNFFRGVVENNKDEKFLGRVQVRIMGVHSDSKADAPTDSLPWCEVIQGTSFGGTLGGVGVSSVLVPGTWVWIFFENDDFTKPIIFGTMIGQMTEEPIDGFVPNEPGVYLKERLKEPDLHPFARSDSTGLINDTCHNHKIKVDGITENVENAAGEKWSELPENSTKAKYPHNNVIETHGGHTIEIDDTEGNERVHIMHKRGTYIEIDKDGSITVKTVKDSYKIIQGNSFELTKINKNEQVTGNDDLKIVGTRTEKITGDVLSTQEAGRVETIANDWDIDISGATQIGLNTSLITLGAGAEFTVLNDSLKEYINSKITAKFLMFQQAEYDTHIHPTGVGPSGPPMAPHSTEMVDYADDAISKLTRTD